MKKMSLTKGIVIGLGAVGVVALGVFGVKKYKESKTVEVKEAETPREALEIEAEKLQQEEISEEDKRQRKVKKVAIVAGGAIAGVGVVVGAGLLVKNKLAKDKGKEIANRVMPIEAEDILYTGYDNRDNVHSDSKVDEEKEGDAMKDSKGGYNPHSEINNIDITDNTSDSFKK